MLNITAIQIFADAMGMTEAEMFKQMELGKVLAEDVLPAVGREFSRVARQNGALDAATEKVNSQLQRFLNTILAAKLVFFQSGFGQGMSDFFRDMSVSIKNNLPLIRLFGSMMQGAMAMLTGALQMVLTPFEAFSSLMKDLAPERMGNIIGAGGTLFLMTMWFHKVASAVGLLNASLLVTLRRMAILAAPLLAVEDVIGGFLGKETGASELGKRMGLKPTSVGLQLEQGMKNVPTVSGMIGSMFNKAQWDWTGQAKASQQGTTVTVKFDSEEAKRFVRVEAEGTISNQQANLNSQLGG